MDKLGIPFLLLGTIVTAFTLILRSVDTLNAYRDKILGIGKDNEALTIEHREMYLRNNFLHLLRGTTAFCLILTLFVFLLPLLTGDTGIWTLLASGVVGTYTLSATFSILKTSIVDYRRMRRCLEIRRSTVSEANALTSTTTGNA